MILYILLAILTLLGLFAGTLTGNIVPDTPDGKMSFIHIVLWLVVSVLWPVLYAALMCAMIYDLIRDRSGK